MKGVCWCVLVFVFFVLQDKSLCRPVLRALNLTAGEDGARAYLHRESGEGSCMSGFGLDHSVCAQYADDT